MNDKIKIFGLIGLMASVIVGIGEFFLHYSHGVLSSAGDFEFFKFVSPDNLTTGHFIAVIGLLFYFAGYFHIYYMLKPGNKLMATVVLFLGISALTIGGIWIGSRAFLGNIVHLENEMSAHTYQSILTGYSMLIEILVNALRIIILVLSIFFSLTILKGGTFYKKWMVFFNPAFILLALLLTILIPSVGKYIIPILMNVTHFILFSLSLYNYTICLKSKPNETN